MVQNNHLSVTKCNLQPSFLQFIVMLNRRTLRIKIMQSLFAYEQCKEANYLLAHDSIDLFFKPDLNSMKVQDKGLLKGQHAVAIKLFEKRFQGNPVQENSDPRINQSVEDALSLHAQHTKKDFSFFRNSIAQEVEKISTIYYSILNLIPAFEVAAKLDKRISSKNFTANPFVVALKENLDLRRETLRRGGGWDQKMDLVRSWFRDSVKSTKEFQAYISLQSPSLEEHVSFIKVLIRKIILGRTPIDSYFEELDLWWAEDHEIIRSMADKTLKSLEKSSVEIQKLSLNWEDDKEFIEKLFLAATQLDSSYHQLIASHTRNWEVDRLPLTDRVILQMALAEMISFPNIPIKVSINEYIELAKEYSTPKSRLFINGILDVLSKELVQTGKIKKSGRGLMDNK